MTYLRVLGKLLISVGVGVLLFVAWTLWGTGLYTQQQQDRLSQEFDKLPVLESSPVSAGDPSHGPPKGYAPGPGAPVFRLKIPKIHLNDDKGFIVVEGVDTGDLAKGPGHYPECRPGFAQPLCTELPEVWPGERGRVIVSGHRTTYLQPFWDLDKLEPGDAIITETRWGRFTYTVTKKEAVEPNRTDIANPAATDAAEIVLTTCNPRFSAAQRLLVFGRMEVT